MNRSTCSLNLNPEDAVAPVLGFGGAVGTVVNPTAISIRTITDHGAVCHRQSAVVLVVNPAAVGEEGIGGTVGGIPRHGAVRHRQSAPVENTTAITFSGIPRHSAVRHRQSAPVGNTTGPGRIDDGILRYGAVGHC